MLNLNERIRASPYYPALAHPVFRRVLLILAGPIGIAFGGPLVAALGARGTLLASALATIALGLITTAVLTRARTRTRAQARASAQVRA